MYSQYSDGHFHPLAEFKKQHTATAPPPPKGSKIHNSVLNDVSRLFGNFGILFSNGQIDTGDILLVLILLFLLLEGDNLELVITLGLLLLFGFKED